MQFRTVGDLFGLIGSGRIDAIAIIRSRHNPQILRVRMRRGTRWDELWLHTSAWEPVDEADILLQDALNTILDQVSPG